MRVTIIGGAIDSSGGFKVAATLGRLLIERGHDVAVIARKPAEPSFLARVKARLKGERIAPKTAPGVYLGSLPAIPVAHAGPLTPADIPDADIVIGTWWQTMELIEHLPESKGVKVHLVQDYEIWANNKVADVDRVLQLNVPKIAISGYLYRLLTEKFQNDHVFLLPNAIDHNLFYAPPRAKGQPTTVGFTYSSDPRKGSDLVVQAVTQARKSYPALKVVAFGHTPPQDAIAVPEWVEFHVLPSPEQIRLLYSQCNAWLFGSRREGFGLPILEAMACRTPVIGMPAGAAPELLADGAGILVGDHDWAEMARAILDVTVMPDAEWLALSRRAQRRATENQWDIVGDKLERILTELLPGTRR